MRTPSIGERIFTQLCKQDGIVIEATEYRFAPPRLWRFDFLISQEKRIAVEIEGGSWSRGRHVRPDGFAKDAEKYNEAALHGWCVLRYPTEVLRKDPNSVINQVKQALLIRSK